MAALVVGLTAAVPVTATADTDLALRRAALLGRLFDLDAYQQAALLLAGSADGGFTHLAAPGTEQPAGTATSPAPAAGGPAAGGPAAAPEGTSPDAASSLGSGPVASGPEEAATLPSGDPATLEAGGPGEPPRDGAPAVFEFADPSAVPPVRTQQLPLDDEHTLGLFDPTTRLPKAPGGAPAGGPPGALRAGPDGTVCPVVGPVRFINDWGFPRSGGRTHQGNDLFAAEGTPLVAVAPSTVARIQRGDVGLGGRTVTLMTADGIAVYYAHLHTVRDDLVVGQQVLAGEPIGTVGRTGNARTTPPHLHIGFYAGGMGSGAFNPFPTLAAACR